MEENRMPSLVVSGDFFIFLGNDTALFLCANSNFDKRFFNIFFYNVNPIVTRCRNGCLVQQVFQICTDKSCCRTRHIFKIYIFCQWFIFGMYFQNFLSSTHIRTPYGNFTIKTSRTKDRRVKDIDTVCRRHNNNSFIDSKSIHLNEHLVQCLLTLIMTTAKSASTASCHSIYLVDKHDTWCFFLRFFK